VGPWGFIAHANSVTNDPVPLDMESDKSLNVNYLFCCILLY